MLLLWTELEGRRFHFAPKAFCREARSIKVADSILQGLSRLSNGIETRTLTYRWRNQIEPAIGEGLKIVKQALSVTNPS